MSSLRTRIAIGWSLTALASTVVFADEGDGRLPLTVVATRLPESAKELPAALSIVDGEQAQKRGASDLRGYLTGITGVEVQPGSDAGPAGSVVAMQGLTEVDAYLLVVDGVPYGGSFNPAMSTLDPIAFDRIEVLRGAAPVMYGATSFVGTINVLRHPAGEQPGRASIQGGSRGTFRGGLATTLSTGAFGQSLLASADRSRTSQDRGAFDRLHLLWRGGVDTSLGRLHVDIDGTTINQVPTSPHPREGNGLSARFPQDANINPRDARLYEDRLQTNFGLDSQLGASDWGTTVSIAKTWKDNTRGFLRDGFATDGVTHNADGFRQHVEMTDIYLDTHLGQKTGTVDWLIGADLLRGRGSQRSANFEYGVLPNGANAPDSKSITIDESTVLKDRRDFTGLYGQLIVRPVPRLTLLAGGRLNQTVETRCGDSVAGIGVPQPVNCDHLSRTRLSGSVGASFAVFEQGQNGLSLFADYRSTYKPAAIDFGPEAEDQILQPETTTTWEAGFKLALADGKVELDGSWFDTRFNNLVIRENVGGLPALANAGKSRLQGFEVEAHLRPAKDWDVLAAYANHSAKFVDYARLRPDGSIQQLAGKYLELSPRNTASGAITYAPEAGVNASASIHYTGERFLNKGNSVVAPGFATVDARIGWKFAKGLGVFVDGRNLNDRRDPVTESELGDPQFYTLSGRSIMGTLEVRW